MTFLPSIFRAPVGTVAFNMRPVRGPWGGSSVFVSQWVRLLKGRGYRVGYDLSGRVDVVVVVDPRDDLQSKAFGMDEIRGYRERHPQTRVLHRVNECDQRKATGFMDALLAKANAVADYTVFISEWVRDYHAARWFDVKKPHSCIYNGADPRVFHPVGAAVHRNEQPFRLVTHHWSDNPLKGFDVYERVDRLIADGQLPGVEFWVIGRWPKNLQWKAARTFPATSGTALASLLRQCHAYLTASRWEPCGMHHVEGAQCGLPLIYHEDGGGIVEAGRKYGVGFKEDVASAIRECRDRYSELRDRLLSEMPSGDRMCLAYADVVQRLLAER